MKARGKSYPIKEQRWTHFHWRQWDRLTPHQRLAYEQYVEDRDNALMMAHIRGTKQMRRLAEKALPAVVAIFMLATIPRAHAHMRDRPDLDPWFHELHSQKGLCCSFVDGSTVADVDWDAANEGRSCVVLPTDVGNDEPSHYCVRLDGTWWAVPDKAVLDDANRYGRAIVWPIYVSSFGGKNKLIGIRCFLRGTEG